MRSRRKAPAAVAAAAVAAVLADPGWGQDRDAGAESRLLQEPLTTLVPGPKMLDPEIENPVAGDPGAAERGMKHFQNFNCAGCHAANGGGGMGPALSNSKFIYGSKPADIYLTIYQGRPMGMPAWGGVLPDKVIWELVTYIQSISKEPKAPWGVTTSHTDPEAPKIEQVPYEYVTSTTPWKFTQPFSRGQRPLKKLNKENEK